MAATSAVITYATMKLVQIMNERKGKPIPNWWKIEDVQGFGLRVTEGELNFMITAQAFPVEEQGPGNFLVRLVSTFMSAPVGSDGFEFMSMPVGQLLQQDFPVYATGEQELQDGIMQLISDEAENILCQILQ
ncbi:hypothetical protein pETSU_276 [Edwardsiella phage pEt-SU]|uniref:Uncharacterized protein n=1 Tax=Edwardsiella phage pEt-SU TaxID=2562142 RepID=A0A4D6DWX3_9CAUD|nr:hypothetical protein HOV39_gp246 [Edwardsiella phage pEt-SU]QBZ70857.1 hypothetical protein pETSU_276 [Edwardsiella phage pEt-SU]